MKSTLIDYNREAILAEETKGWINTLPSYLLQVFTHAKLQEQTVVHKSLKTLLARIIKLFNDKVFAESLCKIMIMTNFLRGCMTDSNWSWLLHSRKLRYGWFTLFANQRQETQTGMLSCTGHKSSVLLPQTLSDLLLCSLVHLTFQRKS